MEQFPVILTGTPVEKEESGELKKDISEIIQSLHEEGKKPFSAERQKTEDEYKQIETSDALLRMMFDRFKLPHDENIVAPEQVHFFTKENFEKEFKNTSVDAGGFHDAMRNIVCLKDGNENAPEGEKEIFDISDMAHEVIHMASHHKYQGLVGENNDIAPDNYRVGYAMTTFENEKPTRKFNGFNEGLVCITQSFMFHDFAEELEKRTGITKEMKNLSHYSRYSKNQDLVLDISEAIGKYRNENPLKSTHRLIKGQFTGDMMPLRDIDDIFGKGSLDLLAEYESVFGTKDDHKRDELIKNYFCTEVEDVGKREEIKTEIEKLK